MVTLEELFAQTRHTGHDRCGVRVYAAGGSVSTRPIHVRVFLFHRKVNSVNLSACFGLALVSVLGRDGPGGGIPFVRRRLSHRVLGHSNLHLSGEPVDPRLSGTR